MERNILLLLQHLGLVAKTFSLVSSNHYFLNPYRQIPETISKKRVVTQGISRKLFPGFFQILQFWGVTQGIFRKLFPGKLHEYLPTKKYFFSQKRGMTQRLFRKLFPISGKSFRKFPCVITRIYEISNFI